MILSCNLFDKSNVGWNGSPIQGTHVPRLPGRTGSLLSALCSYETRKSGLAPYGLTSFRPPISRLEILLFPSENLSQTLLMGTDSLMLTLAIETSGRGGSIALYRQGEFLDEADLAASGRRHARTLVPEISELLHKHHLRPAQLNLIAVSIGPGSFTGLRVGVVCAKTMAYALGCPLVGVDTFLAVAAAQSAALRVHVIDDALRGDVCAGEYLCVDGIWTTLSDPRLMPFEKWQETLPEDAVLSGPGLAHWDNQLAGYSRVSDSQRLPQARFIAPLGEIAAEAGRISDPWTLEPFYMRRSAAEEKADASRATAP